MTLRYTIAHKLKIVATIVNNTHCFEELMLPQFFEENMVK